MNKSLSNPQALNSVRFPRTDYAVELAQQLLRPRGLLLQVRAGVFLSGGRRTGKTTFLRQDLIPALEAGGALVVRVELKETSGKQIDALLREALLEMLFLLCTPNSAVMRRLERLTGVHSADSLSFNFKLSAVIKPRGVTVERILMEIVDKAKVDVVVILDDVQQALLSEEGSQQLAALKAAGDAINRRPDTPGHLLCVGMGVGSHKSLLADLAMRRSQPFAGALSAPFEPLGEGFVEWVGKQEQEGADVKTRLPSLSVMHQGFVVLGSRPDAFLQALWQWQMKESATDETFTKTCEGLARQAVEEELAPLAQCGSLGQALFERIAQAGEDGAGKLFALDAMRHYRAQTGQDVTSPQVQNMLDRLIANQLVHRQAHGMYAVADPFVCEVLRAREASAP